VGRPPGGHVHVHWGVDIRGDGRPDDDLHLATLRAGSRRPLLVEEGEELGMSLNEDVICLLPGDPSCGDSNRNSRVTEVHRSLSRRPNCLDINSVANYADALRR
jgi:hypothetical protein